MSLADTLVLRFAEAHPLEAARLLGAQAPEQTAAVLTGLPEAVAAAVLERLPPLAGGACLAGLAPETGVAWLARLPAERVAGLLRRLDTGTRERLLALLPRAERLRPLLVYPEGTAGALMDPLALAFPEDLELEEARRRLGRLTAHLALELYVVDDDQRLRGCAELREVLDLVRRGSLGSIARRVEALHPRADARAMAVHPGWTERGSLPVVDERGVFLGAVRHERLRQALQDSPEARRARGGLEAALALGELYWLGLSGLFTGLAGSARPQPGEETS